MASLMDLCLCSSCLRVPVTHACLSLHSIAVLILYRAAVPYVCKHDPAGLAAGATTIKTIYLGLVGESKANPFRVTCGLVKRLLTTWNVHISCDMPSSDQWEGSWLIVPRTPPLNPFPPGCAHAQYSSTSQVSWRRNWRRAEWEGGLTKGRNLWYFKEF